MSEAFAKANFESRVDQVFHARAGETTVPLTLKKIVPAERPPAQFESYTMVFSGPPETLLPQAIYELRPENGGEPCPLFLVPVAGDEEGYDYEAVVNRKLD